MTNIKLTEAQQEAVDLFEKYKNKTQVGKILNISRKAVFKRLKSAEKKGYKFPLGQDEEIINSERKLKGASILYDAKGEVKLEWKKFDQKYDQFKDFCFDFVDKLCYEAKGKSNVKFNKTKVNQDILYEICAYDLHFGMYANSLETGDSNYDTKIAKNRLLQAIETLASRSNKPHTIRLILGGDQLHIDNSTNKTPNGGNILDADTRYSIVINKLIGACKESVDIIAKYCNNIEIYVVQGNHDPISSLWLSEVLTAYYSNNKNITICDQKTPRKYATWGKCLSVYGHGDNISAQKWAGLVAAENPKLWGETNYRYARLGHYHTKKILAPIVVDEHSGLEVTFLSSLASSDAWHSNMGYIGNNRGMQAFELDKELGQISQFYYNTKK